MNNKYNGWERRVPKGRQLLSFCTHGGGEAPAPPPPRSEGPPLLLALPELRGRLSWHQGRRESEKNKAGLTDRGSAGLRPRSLGRPPRFQFARFLTQTHTSPPRLPLHPPCLCTETSVRGLRNPGPHVLSGPILAIALRRTAAPVRAPRSSAPAREAAGVGPWGRGPERAAAPSLLARLRGGLQGRCPRAESQSGVRRRPWGTSSGSSSLKWSGWDGSPRPEAALWFSVLRGPGAQRLRPAGGAAALPVQRNRPHGDRGVGAP